MKISVAEAARMLGVSEKSVYRWIKQKKVPVHRIGHQYLFNRTELLEWATAERIPVSVEILQPPRGEPPPPLSQALAAGGIHRRVSGATRDAVLHRVVSLLQLPADVDREYLYQMLLAREALASTSVGGGIAIPHVRSPLVLHVPPAVALCFLEQPVDFAALDGAPVRALFLLLSPTIQAHLHLLSRLSAALHDPELRRTICEQGRDEEISAGFRRVEAGFPGDCRGAPPAGPPR